MINSILVPSSSSDNSSDGSGGVLTEEMVNKIVWKDIAQALNPIAMFKRLKGALSDFLNADSLRSMYDLITADPQLGEVLKEAAGNDFSIIDTIVKILLPSRDVVYYGSVVALLVIVFGQALLIYELNNIISLCDNNTNLKVFIVSLRVCFILSIVMIFFEFFILLYMLRTKATFARHKLRYFYNWIAVLQFGQFGLVSAVSISWLVFKNLSAFKTSVINKPNVIPNISRRVLFAFSVNILMSLVIGLSWAYFCGLDAIILPFIHAAAGELGL